MTSYPLVEIRNICCVCNIFITPNVLSMTPIQKLHLQPKMLTDSSEWWQLVLPASAGAVVLEHFSLNAYCSEV